MPKSLAELRAERPQSRDERAYRVCLAQHLVAEVGALTDELQAIAARLDADEGDERAPRRGGGSPEEQAARARSVEIKARLSALLDEMAEYEGELRVRAIDDGEWRRWVNAHPAREKDQPGYKRDIEVTGGYCNADDLIDDLATYASSWNGEPLQEGDWAVLAASISAADKKQLANLAVVMHESGASIPKWRSGLSDYLRNEPDSNLPEPSVSLTPDSTDKNPLSDTSTTPQTVS